MHRLKLFLLAALSLLVTLGAFEFLLRTVRPEPDMYFYDLAGDYVYNKPGFDDLTTRDIKNGGERPYVRTNPQGQRDEREPSFARTSSVGKRVVVIGDSVAFGWPLSVETSFPRQLEHRLPGLKTVNCSVVGAGLLDLEKIYRDDCSRYAADVVIFQWTVDQENGGADYLSKITYGPHFRIFRLLFNLPYSDLWKYTTVSDEGLPILKKEFFSRENGHLAELRALLRPKLPLYRSLRVVRFVENRWIYGRYLKWIPNPVLLNILSTQAELQSPDPDRAVQLAVRHLVRLKAEVEGSGKQFLLFLTPTSQRLKRNGAGADRRDLVWFKKAARAAGIVLIDMEEEFARSGIGPARFGDFFIPGDQHPNAKGYALYAETLAGWLASRL